MLHTYVITGASRGIGGAIVKKICTPSTYLILNASKASSSLDEVVAYAREHGAGVEVVTGDISLPETAEQILKKASSAPSPLETIVHCAGISYIGLLTHMEDAQWQRILDVNLNSAFYLTKALLPAMIRAHAGKILMISSVWGSAGASCEVAYSASKGGLNLFTKALAKELAPSGISVNALACGMIDTRMNADFTPEEMEDILSSIPCGRMATPEEVADMAALLLQAPVYFTGQIVGFDGGWL